MLNMVVIHGKVFNCADILSYELLHNFGKAKPSLWSDQAPNFYMSALKLWEDNH